MAQVAGSIASNNASVQIATDNAAQGVPGIAAGSVCCNIVGTFVATIAFQGSTDGVNWFNIAGYPVLASGIAGAPALTTTVIGTFVLPVYGYAFVRCISTAYTSGTASILFDSATSTSVGNLFVNTEGLKPGYFASLAPLAVAASPTDIAVLIGSATKTVRVSRVIFGMTTATGAQYVDVTLVKRSGGTQSAVNTAFAAGTNAGPFDSNDAPFTAGGGGYTANPASSGTVVGQVAAAKYFSALTGTVTLVDRLIFDFGTRPNRMPVLRGTTQNLTLTIANGSANAGSADITYEFTEE